MVDVDAHTGVHKIVVCGEGAVGKTAITIQLTSNHFITDYDPTIENTYRKHLVVDGADVMLEILDTAGQEEYGAMRESYFRGGQGFLVVYSVTNRYSFETVPTFLQHILRVKEAKTFPVVVAANKIDLVDERDVTHAEVRELARRLGVPTLEVSARTRTNVEECFASLVREIRKFQASTTNPETAQAEVYRRRERRRICTVL